MPIIRKVFEIGNSRGITIPKSWFEFIEKESGKQIKEVAVEVNQVLKISAILSKKENGVAHE